MSAAKPHTPMPPLHTRLLVAADAQACPVTAALLREAAQAKLAAQKFSHVSQRKLDDLRKNGWVVNGVAITRNQEDGGTERGAITYQGMVFWWWPGQDGAIAAIEAAMQDEREAHQQRITELESELEFSGKQINALQTNERKLIDELYSKKQRVAELQSEIGGHQSELAGYEHSVGHLSALVDELRAKHDALLAASQRVVAAFEALGLANNTGSMLVARSGCEAALVTLKGVAQ